MDPDKSPSPEEEERWRKVDSEDESLNSFGFPAEMLPPLDQYEIGLAMFDRFCTTNGYMMLEDEALKILADTLGTNLERRYLRAYLEEESNTDFSFSTVGAALDPRGGMHVLVAIQDKVTDNFVLPISVEVSQSGEDSPQEHYALEGGAKSFQGVIVSLHLLPRQSGEEIPRYVISEGLLIPPHLTVIELSRFANGAFNSPLRNLVEPLLESVGANIEEVGLIRPSHDRRYPPTSMRYLLDTSNGEFSPRRTHLIQIGDLASSGLISAPMMVSFLQPGMKEWDELEQRPQVVGSESLLSAVEAVAREHGSVQLETPEALEFYRIKEVRELIEQVLFDQASHVWEENFTLRLDCPRVSAHGVLRFLAYFEREILPANEESDPKTETVIPWIPTGSKATGVLSSDSFMALHVSVTIPDSILRKKETPLREMLSEIEIDCANAIVPRERFWREILSLADRFPVNMTNIKEGPLPLREDPSERAKLSVFFPEVRARVVEDLVAIGAITADQSMAVHLRNIKVAPEMKMQMGVLVPVECYFIHVEHQWGTHILKINRNSDLGAVPLEETVAVDGFFPKELYRFRDEMEAETSH